MAERAALLSKLDQDRIYRGEELDVVNRNLNDRIVNKLPRDIKLLQKEKQREYEILLNVLVETCPEIDFVEQK